MNYITEQDEEDNAYHTLIGLEQSTNILPEILASEGECTLRNLPLATVKTSLTTLASYEESRQIKEMKQRGKNVFDPNRKMHPVSSEIDVRGSGKLWIGRRAVGMIRDCVANLTKARATPAVYKNR